jgi:transcriptional regulator with XRE-family HTH domain
MTLSEAVAYGRRIKGYSLRQLEERSGVSNALLSQIENGRIKNPSFKTVIAIARALSIPLERLSDME